MSHHLPCSPPPLAQATMGSLHSHQKAKELTEPRAFSWWVPWCLLKILPPSSSMQRSCWALSPSSPGGGARKKAGKSFIAAAPCPLFPAYQLPPLPGGCGPYLLPGRPSIPPPRELKSTVLGTLDTLLHLLLTVLTRVNSKEN